MANLPESKVSCSGFHTFLRLKICYIYSVMGAIIGEWLGASEGLGVMLTRAANPFW